MKNIVELYKNADMEGKQFIIGSIFPKKFVFDGEIDRTAPTNTAFGLMWQINNKLENKKAVVNCKIRSNYGQVLADGLNSKKFYDDLKKIADLNQLFSSEPLSRDFKLKYRRNYHKKKD